MNRRAFLASTAALASCRVADYRSEARQRGVAFDGFRSTVSEDEFRGLAAIGTTHVTFAVSGFMLDAADPNVARTVGRRRVGGSASSDDRLITLTTLARDAGLEVVLVPTIGDFRGLSRGDIRMRTESDWREWFRQYEQFVSDVAGLATTSGASGLTIGMELRRTVAREHQWRAVAEAARSRFGGWLTYAATWDDYQRVQWWDAVDYVGVQAYFELGAPPEGTTESERQRFLRNNWRPIRDGMEGVSRAFDRPVLFTEIGYQSRVDGTERPWDWREEGESDDSLQADAYTAAFQTFWNQPWFAGMYWWKWYASERLHARDWSRDYTPQNKHAQQVLADWYGGPRGGVAVR